MSSTASGGFTSGPGTRIGKRNKLLHQVFEKSHTAAFESAAWRASGGQGADDDGDVAMSSSSSASASSVAECFDARVLADGRETTVEHYFDEVLEKIRANIAAEFEVICGEMNFPTRLDELDALEASAEGVPLMLGHVGGLASEPASALRPAELLDAESVSVMLERKRALEAELEVLDQENGELRAALVPRRQQVREMCAQLQETADTMEEMNRVLTRQE